MASELEMQEAENCIDRLNEQIAALKAENKRLEREREKWEQHACTGDDVLARTRDKLAAAERALAERAGEVKVGDLVSIIALWSDDEGLDLSFGQGDDLARRILTALYTEPAAPERTCATCHAVLADGPQPFATYEPAAQEGRREVVAWADEDMARHWIDRYASGIDAEPQMTRILSCVTRPTEQAVTEADKRRILDVFEIEWKINGLDPLSALRAAMEAGR